MNNDIIQPTRPGAIDKTSGTPSGFPDFAFEHDGTENNSNPTLTLKSPWGFAVENGLKVADTNNLTTANITYTLPKITGSPQVVSFYWSNGGIYKLTLAVSDSETVGGLAATIWQGEGEGHMIVESDGTNWQVREYEDSGGVFATGTWQKSKEGILKIQQSVIGSGSTVNTETIIKPLVSSEYRTVGSSSNSTSTSDISVKFVNKTTTTVDVGTSVNGSPVAILSDMLLIGRWRT